MLQKRYYNWFAALLAGALLNNCTPSRSNSASVQHYQVTRFTQKDPTQAPVLFGYVDQQESARVYPLKRSMIVVDGKPIFSDSTGWYFGKVQPGTPTIVAKWIGFENIPVERLRIRRGDSIQINFHLQSDKVHKL